MEWISVKDRLPRNWVKVLGCQANCEDDAPFIVYFNPVDNEWRNEAAIRVLITHWMPLPKPPQENSDETA